MKCKHCGDIYDRKQGMADNCCNECYNELTTGKIPKPTSLTHNEAWHNLAPRQKEKNHWS